MMMMMINFQDVIKQESQDYGGLCGINEMLFALIFCIQ